MLLYRDRTAIDAVALALAFIAGANSREFCDSSSGLFMLHLNKKFRLAV